MQDEKPEPSLLSEALAYPFRGSGWIMIVLGAGLSALLTLGSAAPLIGKAAWFAGFGYFTAFYFDIILTTINGRDEPPDWPDITDLWGDIFQPALRTMGTVMIAFFPLFLAIYANRDSDDGLLMSPLVWAGMVFGAFYFPMAILNVAVGNDIMGALPHRVIPDAVRAMPGYLVVAGLLAAVFVISKLAVVAGYAVPFLGGLFAAGISLYFMMAQARLAGSFYRQRLEAEEAEEEDEDRAFGEITAGETGGEVAAAVPVPVVEPAPVEARRIPVPPPPPSAFERRD